MPVGPYTTFAQCVAANKDKADPEAFCGYLEHLSEGDKAAAPPAGPPTQVVVRAGITEVRKSLSPAPWAVTRRKNTAGAETIVLRRLISSLSKDRDGDAFSMSGLKSMKAKLDAGSVPYFLDHGRKAGEFMPSYSTLDMLGKWVKGDLEDGNLYGTAELDGGDPRAQELARKMDAGLPIGHSVGFSVKKFDPLPDVAGATAGGRLFHDVDLMETSAVGIPSNADAVKDGLVMIAKAHNIPPERLQRALALLVPEDTNMELTPQETAQIDAQRKAGKNGVPAQAAGAAPEPQTALTAEALKAAFVEQGKAIGAAIVDSLKSMKGKKKPADDMEEDEEDQEDEGTGKAYKDDPDADEDQDNPKPKGKKGSETADEDDPEPAPGPHSGDGRGDGNTAKPAPKKPGKGASPSAKKTAKPRGMVTVGDGKAGVADSSATAPPAEKAVQPFEFA